MSGNNRQDAYLQLLDLANKLGYVTVDHIIDATEQWNLPLNDVDWLSNSIMTHGILVYEESPEKINKISIEDDYDDFSQTDYENVFENIVELEPSLKNFVEAVRGIKPPQHGEFGRIIYQAKEGNLYARNRIIEMHLRMALRIALQRAYIYDLDVSEVISNACIGLIIAVDKYDPDTSGPFSSYASLWILQNIARNQPTLRPDVYYPAQKREMFFATYPILKRKGCVLCDKIFKCKKIRTFINNKKGYTNEQTIDIILQTQPFLSFEKLYDDVFLQNSYVFGKHKNSIMCSLIRKIIVNDEIQEVLETEAMRNTVNKVLNTLKERERNVICERFGFTDGKEKTLEEIGEILGVTRERIRQIEAKAFNKLRHPSRSRLLREFI